MNERLLRFGSQAHQSMRLRLTDPAFTPALLDFLERKRAVAAEVAPGEVEAGLLGSYNADAMRLELFFLLREWEAEQRAEGAPVAVEFVRRTEPQLRIVA